MSKLFRGFAAAASILVGATLGANAKAQDQCSDILRNGTLASADWKEKSYFHNLVYARFASMRYEASKSERSFGLTIPIGEEVMGSLDYDENAFRAKQKDIEQVYFNDMTDSRELDVAISRGDETIVKAWSDCMASQPGLLVHFTKASNQEAELTLEWKAGGSDVDQVKLAENVLLTDGKGKAGDAVATVLSGADCLKAGAVLKMNRPCSATVFVGSSRVPLLARAKVVRVSGEPIAKAGRAYWPPRVRLISESKSFPFAGGECNNYGGYNPGATIENAKRLDAWSVKCSEQLVAKAYRGQGADHWEAALSSEQVEQGWRLVPATARVDVQLIYGGMHGNRCEKPVLTMNAAMTSLEYRLEAVAPSQKDLTVICIGQPYLQMQRYVAVDE